MSARDERERSASELLRKWSLGRYLASAPKALTHGVLTLPPHVTLPEALQQLASRAVLSAPVVDDARNLFLGFFGVADALRAFLTAPSEELLLVRHQIGPEPGAPGTALLHREKAETTSLPPPPFSALRVGDLVPSPDGHVLFSASDPAYAHLTLLDVVRGSMLHCAAPYPVAPCHRVAVCEPAQGTLRISNIVSQSDIMAFLLQHAASLESQLSQSVSSLGLVVDPDTQQPRGVECVQESEPALDAFGGVLRCGVSALGVLDARGSLVGNLSASDLRCVLPDRWGVLALPVARLLQLESSAAMVGEGRKAQGAVTVTPQATLREVLEVLVSQHLHHVFVCEHFAGVDLVRPLALISTSDILRALLLP